MYRMIVLLCVLTITYGCSSAPESESKKDADKSASVSAESLTGMWTGDWGPSQYDRNNVRIELKWNGSELTGTINPGENAIPIKNASYDPATMKIEMEAETTGRAGPVHYEIEGTVENNSITGTWSHETRKGDFKVTKSQG